MSGSQLMVCVGLPLLPLSPNASLAGEVMKVVVTCRLCPDVYLWMSSFLPSYDEN